MMKRISALMLVFACAFATMVTPSYAVDTRASKEPTQLAPESWYWSDHQFTATYYTFSSYLIDGSRLNIISASCDKPFSIEVYTTQDVMFDSVEAEYNDGFFQYQAGLQVNDGIYDEFYFVIRNEGSTPITSSDHGWVSVNWYDYIR